MVLLSTAQICFISLMKICGVANFSPEIAQKAADKLGCGCDACSYIMDHGDLPTGSD